MSAETAKYPIVSLSSEEMKSKIQSALKGATEVLILPKFEWTNFVDAASTSLEPMARDMHLKQNNVIEIVMKRMGFEPGQYLTAAKDVIGLLRPDFLSAMDNSDALKIEISERSVDPSATHLNVNCGFIDQENQPVAQANAYISLETHQDGGRWEYYSFSARTSVDGHWTFFSMVAYDGLL